MRIPLIKNTFTNYIMMGVRLLQGILLTRWLVAYLGSEYYGLWSLLWSFFVYTLLLDFGFGVAAQKYTSAEEYRTNLPEYNRIVSTIFTFYSMMAVLILTGTAVASFFLPQLLKLSDPSKLAYCRTCFLVFGLGTGFLFPMGIFPEILVGLQKIYLRNYINIVSKIVEIAGIYLIAKMNGGLLSFAVFTLALYVTTNLVMAVCIARIIRGFRIAFRFSKETFRRVASFSWYVYLMAFSRVVLSRGADLLICIFTGVANVGIYHVAGRVPEMCFQGASQYQENICPVSAALHARGDGEELRKIIFHSMRWSAFMGAGIVAIALCLAGEMLGILFRIYDPEVTRLCRLLLIPVLIAVVFVNVPNKYLLMTGHHRFLACVTVSEAVVNLAADVILLHFFPGNIACVVYVALTAKTIVALILTPYMMRRLSFSGTRFLRKVVLAPLFCALPPVILLIAAKEFHGGDMLSGTIRPVLAGVGALILYLILSHRVILSPEERRRLTEKAYSVFSAATVRR